MTRRALGLAAAATGFLILPAASTALAQNSGNTTGPAAGTNVTPNTAPGATGVNRKQPGGQDDSDTTGSVGVGVPADKAKTGTEGGLAQKPPGSNTPAQ